jgi:hypothetical protein
MPESMATIGRKVRVFHEHSDLGPDDDFHEWIPDGHTKAEYRDSLGRAQSGWTRWVFYRCNNLDCEASAIVNDRAIRAVVDGWLTEATSGSPGERS